VLPNNILSLTNCLAFQIPCVSAFRLDWQVCAIVVHVKWATFFIIHLKKKGKKELETGTKSSFFSNRSLSVRQDSRKQKKRLRDSKFDRIPFKPSAAPTLPTAKGVHGCFFFTPKQRKKQQEHFWILCLCLSRASTAAPSYSVRVCARVCLLFLYLEIFYSPWSSTRAMFVSTWNFYLFFSLLHSSLDITFFLNRLLIH